MWHYLGRGGVKQTHTRANTHTRAQTYSCLQSVRDQRERIKCGPVNGILNMSFFSADVKMSVRMSKVVITRVFLLFLNV